MAKDITRFAGRYVTSATFFSYPNSTYNNVLLDLAGFSTSTIIASSVVNIPVIGTAFIYADPNITIPCIGYTNVNTYGTPTVSSTATISLVSATYPSDINFLIGNYLPSDLNGLGYVNNATIGSATITPGPVTITAIGYANTSTAGIATIIRDPILAMGVYSRTTYGTPIIISFLPPKVLAVTANNGLDLKLFNISEQVAGLQEIVGYYDIDFDEQGDFSLEQGMRTNLIMSLFCERRAAPYEIALPSMRRGWWGNINSSTSGFEIGSKLWLLEQNRLTVATVNLAQQWSQQGLQWLVDDGLAAKVVVTASAQNLTAVPGVAINVAITTDANTVEYKWYTTWSNTQ